MSTTATTLPSTVAPTSTFSSTIDITQSESNEYSGLGDFKTPVEKIGKAIDEVVKEAEQSSPEVQRLLFKSLTGVFGGLFMISLIANIILFAVLVKMKSGGDGGGGGGDGGEKFSIST